MSTCWFWSKFWRFWLWVGWVLILGFLVANLLYTEITGHPGESDQRGVYDYAVAT